MASILIWPSLKTPIDEVEAIKRLQAHVSSLKYSIEEWESSLVLYKLASNPPPSVPRNAARKWRFLACDNCIMELFHLRARLLKIQSVVLAKCPSVRNAVDFAGLRSARKKLDEYFPSIEALRHSTAHEGENEAYPELHAPDGTFALRGFREPDRFSAPYQGVMHHLDITDESLRRISEVIEIYVGAFAGVAAQLEKEGHLE